MHNALSPGNALALKVQIRVCNQMCIKQNSAEISAYN